MGGWTPLTVVAPQNESFTLSLHLPDGVICEEILPTTNGGDAIEQIVFAARENSEWARAENILAENYMLKVEGVDHFITQLHLALHRVRILQVCTKTFVVPRLQVVPKTADNEELAATQEASQKQLEVAEIDMQSDLAAIIPGLTEYLQLENEDITAYRVSMTVERNSFTRELATQMREEEVRCARPALRCLCALKMWLVSDVHAAQVRGRGADAAACAAHHQRGREPAADGEEPAHAQSVPAINGSTLLFGWLAGWLVIHWCWVAGGRADCAGVQEVPVLLARVLRRQVAHGVHPQSAACSCCALPPSHPRIAPHRR